MNAPPALLISALLRSSTLRAPDDDKHDHKWYGLRTGHHPSNFEGDNGSTADRGGHCFG